MTVAQLRQTLARLSNVPEPALRHACRAVEQIALQEGGTITAGRARRVYKLKAITRIKRSGDTVTATVWGTPTGFWVWKNTGTDAHTIPSRPPTARRPRPMYGRGYAHPISRKQIRHPGSRGRGAWRAVVRRSRPVVAEQVAAHVARVVRGG